MFKNVPTLTITQKKKEKKNKKQNKKQKKTLFD